MRFITKTVTALVLSALFAKANAIESFVVEDIQVEGLQRVELGTFFTALPIRVGETLDDARVPSIIRSVYKTGNFDFVKLEKEGNTLKVIVAERPVISNIIITGNRVLKTEQLQDGMRNAGVVKGEVLNSFVLEKIEQGITDQYFSNGHYHIEVDKQIIELSRNRIQLKIDIKEGGKAKIKEFNIIGNNVFSDEELLAQFELSVGGLFSFLTDDNKYSSVVLEKDLETLTSYYKDRGYLKFEISNTDISLSDNAELVYVTIALNEGEIYKISEINVLGNSKVDEELIRKVIPISEGDSYSAAAISFGEEQIKNVLGIYGYAFPSIRTVTEIIEDTNEAKLIVAVDPGERQYVNNITFEGNVTTDENVLRRELRINEGSALSSSLIERSKLRLQRLPFIEEVTIDTPRVENEPSKANLNFTVKERSAAQIGGGIGYNDFYGTSINGELSHSNFMGTGNSVAININTNKAVKTLRVNYTDNYFTDSGIGLSTNLNYTETDYGKLNLISQSLDTLGVGAVLYFPLSEFSNFSAGFMASTNKLTSPATSSQRVIDFFELLGADSSVDDEVDFDQFSLNLGYGYNTLNRAIFPTNGFSHNLGLEVATEIGDLEYYKATYDYNYYFPLSKGNDWIFSVRGGLAYGEGFGKTSQLPYFSNFYAGGSGTMRGFETNTIGPRDIQRIRTTQTISSPLPGQGNGTVVLPAEYDLISVRNYSIGGNARFLNSFELIFPTPFVEDSANVRTSFFVDMGNVWDTKFNVDEFSSLGIHPTSVLLEVPDFSDYKNYRASYGISLQWLSAFGPLQFSLSRPIKSESYDQTETFSFTIGRTF
ncbi:MAG: outer membrane protein assembly factor BamA [Kangiellaceae bacterium]|nr:outer membrane protein assembly factor BamA [Kangiellaceae bacterium]